MKNFKLLSLIVLFILFISANFAFSQKLKAEDIVAKHLDSIGTKENRAKIKNIAAVGMAEYKTVRSATYDFGKGATGGTIFLSEANKMYFGSKFNSVTYPLEEVVYDNKSVETAFIKPGQRSALGYYILNNRDVVREGLFGGSLSTAWSLFDLQSHQAKVDSAGKKKINGRDAYVLNYIIKASSPLTIKLYFDAETFQHVRTEYRRAFPAPFTGKPTESSFQVQTVHLLTENFSNFKKVDGITLPHSYQINLLYDGKVTDEIEWKFEFSEFRFNQKIDPASFETK